MNWLLDSESVIRMLITAAIESALLVLVVYVLLRLIGRWISPSWRVALWTIPLVRLVVLVLPVVSLSLFATLEGASLVSTEPHPNPPLRATDTAYELALPLFQSSEQTDNQISTTPTVTQSRSLRAEHFQLAIVIWIVGVALCGVRWFLMSIALRRILNRGEELRDLELQFLIDETCGRMNLVRPVRCVVTEQELGPATCGFIRPKIILPKRLVNGLTRSELEMVIAHEMEHVRRGDFLLATIGQLAILMHWYNPLAYYVRRALQREMELAVDAATIGKIGPKRIGEYGDLLIRLVQHPTSTLCTVQMARPGKDLHRRITRLVGWQETHWAQRALGAVAACLLMLFGLCEYDSTPAIAQQKADSQAATDAEISTANAEGEDQPEKTENKQVGENESERRLASGRVLDSARNPVPNAQLFAEVYTDDKTMRSVSATANENGEFTIAYPASVRAYETYHTWVYAEGHAVRVVNMARAFADGQAENVEIQLPPLEAREFKILQPDGKPSVDAVVLPRYVDVPNGAFAADDPTGLSNHLPKQLKPLLSRKTDQQGRVRIEGIPLALLGSVEVITPTCGRQHFRRLSGEYNEPLRLVAAGRINGSIKVESPKQYAGTKLVVYTEHGGSREGLAETELDENGRFEIPAIGFGRLLVYLTWEANAEVHPVDFERQSVQPDQTLNLEIDVRPTIPVTGLILTADTQEPVRGARISHRYSNQRYLRFSDYVETDDQGRYTTRLVTGEVARQVSAGITSSYDYPRRLEPILIPSDAEEYEIPKILIHPKRLVSGKLVDDSGNPVSDVAVVLHTGAYRHVAGKAETNADGSFEMRVRDWDYFSKAWQGRWYWAILKQPAVDTDPPRFTRLELVNNNPDNLMLRLPKD